MAISKCRESHYIILLSRHPFTYSDPQQALISHIHQKSIVQDGTGSEKPSATCIHCSHGYYGGRKKHFHIQRIWTEGQSRTRFRVMYAALYISFFMANMQRFKALLMLKIYSSIGMKTWLSIWLILPVSTIPLAPTFKCFKI